MFTEGFAVKNIAAGNYEKNEEMVGKWLKLQVKVFMLISSH
jgi:hypothetical protein